MNTLIIGGTRFVGDSLARQLLADGHSVTVANRGRTPDTLPDSVTRLRVDIGQPGQLEAALAGQIYDAVINMIAQGTTRTKPVLEAVLPKAGHYLQCGSTGVYAPLKYCPADEDHPTAPPEELGGFAAKVEADELAAKLCAERRVPLTIIRPSNIIGAGDVPLDIWGARNPKFFQRLLAGRVISVPNDGQALLQPVHRDDVARPFVLALANPAPYRLYNVSSAYALTLDYYVEVLGDLLGRRPVVEHVPAEELLRRYPDPQRLNPGGLKFLCLHMCFQLGKIRQGLGYEPQWRPEMALEQSLEWMFGQDLICRV
jgi:nucleoside-diphosphate-sugar epimerase